MARCSARNMYCVAPCSYATASHCRVNEVRILLSSVWAGGGGGPSTSKGIWLREEFPGMTIGAKSCPSLDGLHHSQSGDLVIFL